MAYTTIDDPELYFQTKLYTGNGGTQSITLDGSGNMRIDWTWIKKRNGAADSSLMDSVRGVRKSLRSNSSAADYTESSGFSSFDSNGFSFDGTAFNHVNRSSDTFVAWNWKAGGSAPAITYVVKVVSDSGNKYRFDDFGTSAVTLDLQEGGTYTFDQSDSSNAGHPLRFYTSSDKSGGEYTTGVTTTGTAGSSGAKTVITVAASAPTLYYQCSNHAGMGGQANTNSTFGSSNFSGSIQSTVSANTTAGFSIISYTGTGSNATVGHGLGVAPKMIIIKHRSDTYDWVVYHKDAGNTGFLRLNATNAIDTGINMFQNTDPTSSAFSISTHGAVNDSSDSFIAYCFAEKQGYSKFSTYEGNGNSDGTFVYTGFRPAFVITKRADTGGDNWHMLDNKRDIDNPAEQVLQTNDAGTEATTSTSKIDFLSNGFKCRGTGASINTSGLTYIYMAFAETPFVNSNGIVTNAR